MRIRVTFELIAACWLVMSMIFVAIMYGAARRVHITSGGVNGKWIAW